MIDKGGHRCHFGGGAGADQLVGHVGPVVGGGAEIGAQGAVGAVGIGV